MHPDPIQYKNCCKYHLLPSLIAAYREIFVSRCTAQLAWFDSIANSSLLIRMFAITTEFSFSGLFALAMLRVNSDLPAAVDAHANKFKLFMTTNSPYILFVCIFLAQFFATGGLITKNQTLFAIKIVWILAHTVNLQIVYRIGE